MNNWQKIFQDCICIWMCDHGCVSGRCEARVNLCLLQGVFNGSSGNSSMKEKYPLGENYRDPPT